MQGSMQKSRGFTLIELIIVIIILGLMAVGVSGFIRIATQTYINVSERDEITSGARFVLERLNREIRAALPNSIRTTAINNSSVSQCIEFVPIKASSTYINIPTAEEAPSLNVRAVEFNLNATELYSCPATCNDFVSVYPINTNNDIYSIDTVNGTGQTFPLDTFIPPTPVADIWTLTLDSPSSSAGVNFTNSSPTQRLYVFDDVVSYCYTGKEIIRYNNYGLLAVQPSAAALQSLSNSNANVNRSLMSKELAVFDRTLPPFFIDAPTLSRNAVVNLRLNFVRTDESVVFNHKVHIKNTP